MAELNPDEELMVVEALYPLLWSGNTTTSGAAVR